MHLKSQKLSPPGGFKYTQPQSGHTMTGITMRELLKQVAQHRANMNYPTKGSLGVEVEESMCQALSPEDQVAYCTNGERVPKTVHWGMVKQFLSTAASWMNSGAQLEPQAEANRRAAICLTCPLNVPMSGCGVCKATLAGLRSAVLQRSTPSDAGLQACGVCGCDNKTQVHVPLQNLKASRSELQYPAWCWKADAAA